MLKGKLTSNNRHIFVPIIKYNGIIDKVNTYDYKNRIRVDLNMIPKVFIKDNIIFTKLECFEQNNYKLSKEIKQYVLDLNLNNYTTIGGESYQYNLFNNSSNCIFYSNQQSIIDVCKYNYKLYNKPLQTYLIDYNRTNINFTTENILINLSNLNLNLIKCINNSKCKNIIIINCKHKQFWSRTKYLTNYKLKTRKHFIDYNLGYYITVNLFILL
tara:strand:+ start:337 stop:978 length:642 start_codon:yes stop_codon:yes gene_type:complete